MLLWTKGDKAQKLALEILDIIHERVKKGKLLSQLWFTFCLMAMTGLGDIPLAEFLRALAFRLTRLLTDELKDFLVHLIKITKTTGSVYALYADSLLAFKVRLLRAARTVVPNLYPELRRVAIETEPQIASML